MRFIERSEEAQFLKAMPGAALVLVAGNMEGDQLPECDLVGKAQAGD